MMDISNVRWLLKQNEIARQDSETRSRRLRGKKYDEREGKKTIAYRNDHQLKCDCCSYNIWSEDGAFDKSGQFGNACEEKWNMGTAIIHYDSNDSSSASYYTGRNHMWRRRCNIWSMARTSI